MAALLGCSGPPRDTSRPAEQDIPTSPSDSLALGAPDGTEIWYTLTRDATGSDGTRCIERGLEIRRGRNRIKVPLLYTGSPPVLLNDSTMRAQLWTHCVSGDAYLVDLRTGHPVRERLSRKP